MASLWITTKFHLSCQDSVNDYKMRDYGRHILFREIGVTGPRFNKKLSHNKKKNTKMSHSVSFNEHNVINGLPFDVLRKENTYGI